MRYDDDEITPVWVAITFARWFWIGAGALILAGAVTIGGWQMGWWFRAQDTTRQAQLTQNGYANQTTLRQQVTSQIAQSEQVTTQIAAAGNDSALITQLRVQRAAIDGQACYDAAQITGTALPAQQAQWVTANCAAGTLSPSSPDYVTGAP